MKHSKYYYDYTRNMSVEQEKEFNEKNHCGRPTCELETCICCKGMEDCPNEECECETIEDKEQCEKSGS